MEDQLVDIPAISDASFADLLADPYPIYERARALGPVVRVEAAGLPLVTGYDDIIAIERDPGTFSSVIPESNVVRMFGTNLMRKDGEDHKAERQAINPSVQPGTAKRCWGPRIEAIVDDVLGEVEGLGRADLFETVASPISGRALAEVVGFRDTDWRTIARWSQNMMDGSANYSGDPAVTERALETGREIEAAVDRSLAALAKDPDDSMLSSMQTAGLTPSQIYGNAKVAVGGGFNEPRDALLSLALGLLTNPDQLRAVFADGDLWPTAFEEAVRWISPIGMYPRKLTRDAEVGGVRLPAGALIGLSVAAANREPGRYDAPERFDIYRKNMRHLAFGSGPHFCAGTWVARLMIGRIAAPRLFGRLRNLRLPDLGAVTLRGWVFRGPTSFPAEWDT